MLELAEVYRREYFQTFNGVGVADAQVFRLEPDIHSGALANNPLLAGPGIAGAKGGNNFFPSAPQMNSAVCLSGKGAARSFRDAGQINESDFQVRLGRGVTFKRSKAQRDSEIRIVQSDIGKLLIVVVANSIHAFRRETTFRFGSLEVASQQ